MEKLILVDITNKLKDMEKAVDDLTSQLETYFEKCVKVKTDNMGILRKKVVFCWQGLHLQLQCQTWEVSTSDLIQPWTSNHLILNATA